MKKILLILLCAPIVVSAQFKHNLQGDKLPWSSEPKIEGENYRFMIIGDLTGAEVDGYFVKAVDRINDLDPDFVLSVGDLINGYTTEKSLINQQWDSFNDRASKLNMPFIYVPGNHDVANNVLVDEWRNRLGYNYYSFNIGNALFLVLDNFEPGADGLSSEQVAYMKDVLSKNDPKMPIYVFSHAPLWDLFENNGYKDLAPTLFDRNTTYFCGHEHTYFMNVHKGQNHYMLASVAAGKMPEEAALLGNFHNFMHVTVKGDKATMANLRLEGVLPVDIVSQHNKTEVTLLTRQNWASIRPTVVNAEKASSLSSEITLINSSNSPFIVKGVSAAPKGFKLSPAEINQTIAPNSSIKIPIILESDVACDVETMPNISYKMEGYIVQGEDKLQSSRNSWWTIDNTKKVIIDKETPLKRITRFGAIEESWDWSSLQDGTFNYSVNADAKNLYIKIKTEDDKLITHTGDFGKVQDMISICISADATSSSKDNIRCDMIANTPAKISYNGNMAIKGMKAECTTEGNSLIAKISIPRKYFKMDVARFNFGFKDLDDPNELEPSVLWWKPTWGGGSDYNQSGVFIIK